MRWKCARFLWFYGARTKLNAVMEVSAKLTVINFESLGHGEFVHPLAWRFTGSIDELHIIIFISQVHSSKPVGCAYNWLMGSAINRVWPGTRPNSPKRLWPTWRRSTRGTDRRNRRNNLLKNLDSVCWPIIVNPQPTRNWRDAVAHTNLTSEVQRELTICSQPEWLRQKRSPTRWMHRENFNAWRRRKL